MNDHRTTNYIAAFAAVIASQFDIYKALEGGMAGATALLRTLAARRIVGGMLAENERAMGRNQLHMLLDGPAASMPRDSAMQQHAQNVQLLRTVSKIGGGLKGDGGEPHS